jgi:hypothetical protein
MFAGWVHADERDGSRRLHPDLRPWNELSEEVRDKHRSQVLGVIGTAV